MTTKAIDILLPYQRAWLEDQAPVRLWEKSRRIGASWVAALEAVMVAGVCGGNDAWYVGYNEDMTREFIADAEMWARAMHQYSTEAVQTPLYADEGILTFELRLLSGHVVKALSSRPTNLRGKGGIVYVDESAFHDDLPGLIKAAMAFLIWGGRVAILSSHNGEDSEFNALIKRIQSGEINYSLHRTTFDDALAQGLYRRICLKLGREWTHAAEAAWRSEIRALYGTGASEELDCIPSGKREGALWSQDDIDRHRVTAYPPLARVLVGVDPMGSAASETAEAGIVVGGKLGDHLYALEDASLHGLPEQWASRAVGAYYAHKADAIVAESNFGGDMVASTIHNVDSNVNVILVHAARGKLVRAEPIAALYPRGLVHHVGRFPALEHEMRCYDGTGKSPNRMDALVWVMSELTDGYTPGDQGNAGMAGGGGLESALTM